MEQLSCFKFGLQRLIRELMTQVGRDPFFSVSKSDPVIGWPPISSRYSVRRTTRRRQPIS
jgi:hypothetical protein